MFFFTKSAICIGIVTALALSTPQVTDLGATLEADGVAAAVNLGRACTESAACTGVGARVVAAVADRPDAVSDAAASIAPGKASDPPSARRPASLPHLRTRPPHPGGRPPHRVAATGD